MVIYQDSNQTHRDNYLTSINNTMSEETLIVGKLFFSNSLDDSEVLWPADFKEGSFKYDNEICDGQKFLLGSTYSGRIEVGLYKDYNLQEIIGKKIGVAVRIKSTVTIDRWFEIPFGTFEITEASQEENYIKIVAYDNLINGNENDSTIYTSNFHWLPETVLFAYCTSLYKLGGLVTDENIYGINLNNLMPLDETGQNPIEFKSNALNYSTQREIMSDISQILGCICTSYRDTESATWYNRRRTSNPMLFVNNDYNIRKIGQNTVNINENKIKNLKIASNKIKFDGVIMHVLDSIYTAGDVLSGGRIYEFTTKLMDNNTDWERQAMVNALWTNTLSLIDYTPVEIDYFGDPALEVGDEIIIPYKGSTIKSFISSIEYSLNGSQKIKCCEFNTVVTGNISDATQKEQERIKQELAGKAKVIKITENNFNSTNITTTQNATYISDDFKISQQNYFILQGVLKINASADNTIKLEFFKRADSQTTSWNADGMDTEFSIKAGTNYVNIFNCFNIENLHNLNAVKMNIKTTQSGGTYTLIVANLSLTGSII